MIDKKKYMAEYRAANREKLLEKKREYFRANRDPEKEKIKYKKWLENNKEKKAIYDREKRKANPEIFKARDAVKHAIRDGKMIRGSCSVCGNKKTEAHHPDYSKPLEVVWLCKKHHGELHRITVDCVERVDK